MYTLLQQEWLTGSHKVRESCLSSFPPDSCLVASSFDVCLLLSLEWSVSLTSLSAGGLERELDLEKHKVFSYSCLSCYGEYCHMR